MVYSFIQQSLNSGFAHVQILLAVFREISDGDDLWQWSRLEVRLYTYLRSSITRKQFIIIIIIIIFYQRFILFYTRCLFTIVYVELYGSFYIFETSANFKGLIIGLLSFCMMIRIYFWSSRFFLMRRMSLDFEWLWAYDVSAGTRT